jgi:tetratricopeptide (TPR) repeat protein
MADAAELAALSPPGEAEPLWRRVAAGGSASLASRALAALAEVAAARNDRAGAAALLRRALAKEEEAGGRDSAGVAVRLNALGPLVPPREGTAMLERALAIDRRLSGDRHPETATTLANLAGLYLDTGRANEALRAATAALSIFEETLGPDHPRMAGACTMAAFCWRAKGDRARAEDLLRRALAIDAKAYGPRHPDTLDDVRNLAGFLRETGRAGEAAELEKRLR